MSVYTSPDAFLSLSLSLSLPLSPVSLYRLSLSLISIPPSLVPSLLLRLYLSWNCSRSGLKDAA